MHKLKHMIFFHMLNGVIVLYDEIAKQAWQLWVEGRWIDLIDATLVPKSDSTEMMRCINIAFLCVQENAADRPTMSDVVRMLSSETMIMVVPKQPACVNARVGNEEAPTAPEPCSINDMTLSIIIPR